MEMDKIRKMRSERWLGRDLAVALAAGFFELSNCVVGLFRKFGIKKIAFHAWEGVQFKSNIKDSILPTAGGKVKNAQNHRQIDALKAVIYGILYYRRRWVYYFSSLPGAKVAI